MEDLLCEQCAMVSPRLYRGRGDWSYRHYCDDCWAAWRWNVGGA